MTRRRFPRSRILIVDDTQANVLLLKRILEAAGYNDIQGLTDSRQVLPVFEQFQPDLLLLDFHMPHLDGLGVMAQVATKMRPGEYFPILMLTADISPQAKMLALSKGAKDFLTKPFDAVEVLLRIDNLLETRSAYQQLEGHAATLADKVRERTAELADAQVEMFKRLALAAEYRDDNTGEHTQRVGLIAARFAPYVPGMPPADVLQQAAQLHDVGKLAIPDSILFKPSKLTEEEFRLIRSHTWIGARILGGSRVPLLQLAEQIAMYHHERWDGAGYSGLRGEAIPLAARIVAVADVFDVLTHERPYKKAWPVSDALDEIRRGSGTHFDPKIVQAFLQMTEQTDLIALGEAVGAGRGVTDQAMTLAEVSTARQLFDLRTA